MHEGNKTADKSAMTSPGTESAECVIVRSSLPILVVDDEPAILEYLAELLTAWGHRVLPARCCSLEDAQEILDDARMFAFDVAILGTVMPGMDGIQLAERLSSVSPSTRLVLAIEDVCIPCATALREKGVYVQALPAPFEVQDLKNILRSAGSERNR
jgi:DNA-binding NtrC family response regulator